MKNLPFLPADILLPRQEYLENWSVVACDQYSSNPEYWIKVMERVQDKVSAFHLILPEAWLNTPFEYRHQHAIPTLMDQYLREDVFEELPSSYIYVERTLASGKVRRGLIGMVDLEAYDYHPESDSAIRATEATIVDRIPPRVSIRLQAPLELPHVLLLADDQSDLLLGSVEAIKEQLPVLYDFDLMEDGGHICGRLVSGDAIEGFTRALENYADQTPERYTSLHEENLLFAVGDGNHSLATAKTIWEQLKSGLSEEERQHHPARYALAELENIHDQAQKFEPIHRILTRVEPSHLLRRLEEECCSQDGYPLHWYSMSKSGTLYLDKDKGELAVAILQGFLDRYLEEYGGVIDYIHGGQELQDLAQKPRSIGFELPAIQKASLFRGVIADGALPRKTFSMGHACEKRYYLEGKRIR